MVQIIQEGPRRQSFAQKLNIGVGRGLEGAQQLYDESQEKEALKRLGVDLSGIKDSELRKIAFSESLKGQKELQKQNNLLKQNQSILSDIERRRDLPEGSLSAYINDPKMAESVTKPTKESKIPVGEKPVPPEISKQIKKILADNPKSDADTLRFLMDEAGIPPTYSNPYTENRRRTEEQGTKTDEDRRRALRQETLPVRTELANKARFAEKGIQNKQDLLRIIREGDIDDPTFAALAEALPMNLGKRMLSDDTVTYKAGLVDEFGDLRNIFQGQTRVKEIELLESKIADIYLTNDQKEAVLKSRINALRADIIRAEAAAELEDKELGILQFSDEVEKIAKPKLDALFNQILDEQKSIIDSAERRKKGDLPLDPADADDFNILQQILKEAGGDKQEARRIAKSKGYKF